MARRSETLEDADTRERIDLPETAADAGGVLLVNYWNWTRKMFPVPIEA